MPPVKRSPFYFIRKLPFTISITFTCIVAFAVCAFIAGGPGGPRWTSTLLRMGAQFSPLTLDREWYRIVTHIFLHGSVLHLCVNVYALMYAGIVVERRVGSARYAFVFFVCAMAAALASMHWNLFTVGLGTSGAIAGLFGFFLLYNIFHSARNIWPTVILLTHFTLFAILNVLFPVPLYADYAALYGGFLMGVVTGVITFARGRRTTSKVRMEYVMILFLLLMYLTMPGYQVRYFRFFQQMVAAEDTTRYLVRDKLTDDDMRMFIRNYHHWEEIEARLKNQKNLPMDLTPDTSRLRRYIDLRKQENLLKKMVVQREAYVFLDSVERLHEIMQRYMNLDFALWSRIRPGPPVDSILARQMIRIYYDSTGREVAGRPAAYWRMGIRDSLGRWDGPFREYDGNGRLRIKGIYRRDKRDGVFLYYDDGGRCVEAGRYVDDRKFGKWQTFHRNGRLGSETFHNNGHFVSAVWDTFGNPVVVDGNGREIQLHDNGVIALSGEYRHGQRDGVWYGWYDTGEMHFEETYVQGRLAGGKSRSPQGETFVYDESSLYPIPEGGLRKFQEYLKSETRAFKTDDLGHVKLSFRVTPDGHLADLKIDQGATPALDAKARSIVLSGPRWLPARQHGYNRIDAWTNLQVEFY